MTSIQPESPINSRITFHIVEELSWGKLSRLCNPNDLPFNTTDELPDLKDVIGQPRAFRALELGVEVGGIGYNIFVLGIPDSGRSSLTLDYLQRKAALTPAPDDWCYVNNFDDLRHPLALRLPAGRAAEFCKDMLVFISECKLNLPRVFMSEEYNQERERLLNAMREKLDQELNQLEENARQYGFVLMKTPYGLFLGPGINGNLISPDEFEKLPEDQKEKLRQIQVKLSEVMERALAKKRGIEQTTNEMIQDLDQRTSLFVIQPGIDDLKSKYAAIQSVLAYLDQVQTDIVHNISRFRPEEKTGQNPLEEKVWAIRYQVNVLVNNADRPTAPVIVENQPTYYNLLGTIEHDIVFGASYTDFSKIRAGALHRANGGYLILPARDVLINPYAWEGLKRVLHDGEIRILELGSQMGLVSTATLEPEPIPLNVKVILVGTPALYYLLRAYDEDFAKLFKIRAEFAIDMERNAQSELEYAQFIKSVIDRNHLLPFDRSAVARIIEQGSRMVESQEKLSTQFGIIADLICESSFWAQKDGQTIVDAHAVQKALDERIFRSNLVEERIQGLIQENTLMVDVTGSAVGQINALSVSDLGDYAFGRPNRVTASVWAGQMGVIDIERQARLSGPIHTKGVLIISGFLGERYGQKWPLNLTASLTFEQSYDEIEGDSASAAELLALLSAISGIPIDQSRAITGSINQHGQIQAIGSVNEKIEGFFRTCQQKGLTGQQGVVIPIANQRNLMLPIEILDAVEQKMFHIWTSQTLDDAIMILTGSIPGERLANGDYPQGTFNHAVVAQLEAFARVMNGNQHNKRKNKTGSEALPGSQASSELFG
ncbi:MAG TPA: ATP-binding protein [Anaerolineaceae bacterium]|nr:ATP-binding protein [Anaerolineaceae bacterium]